MLGEHDIFLVAHGSELEYLNIVTDAMTKFPLWDQIINISRGFI